MRMTPRTTVAATATLLALGGLAAPSAAPKDRLPSECDKGTMSATSRPVAGRPPRLTAC